MPKRSKPRKPTASSTTRGDTHSPSPRELRRKKTIRGAAITIVFALVATFLIGAMAGSPAKAAEPSAAAGSASLSVLNTEATLDPATTPVASEPDTDLDGIPNNADSDIDGDGIVNGVDGDIDGDGTANSADSDPAATNGDGGVTSTEQNLKLPSFLPAELDNPGGRFAIAAVILGAGAALFLARRKRK